MTPEEIKLRIRKARTRDIETITAIENRESLHPWKERHFTAELTHDIAYFFVAENVNTGEIAGYIIFWAVEEMMELHNIVVSGKYRKKGIGKQLVRFMLETAKEKKAAEIFLEVRGSNTEAIVFYESFGFCRVGVRNDYYSDPREDALIYKLTLPAGK
jgi:ribosomal-protein-alanine N-acetyltransferase